MSNFLFPSTLAGVDIKWTRTPLDATHIDEALSGKETRWTASTWPRYRYECDINILRADSLMAAAARNREWQQFCSHVGRHFGRLDSFLLIDPDDSSVTDVGFAVGDGVTAAFQLQRTLAGDVIDAAGVEYAAQTKPYTNLVKNSSFETDTNADGTADNWASYDGEPSAVPQYLSIIPGRLPNTKAQRVSWGTNAAGVHGITQNSAGAPAFVAGQWYTMSVFARASGTNVGKFVGLGWNTGPNQLLTIACPALSASWQRYVFQVFWNAGSSINAEMYLTISAVSNGAFSATGSFGDLDFDDVQVSTGQWGASDLLPISTPAAATATLNPSYWPAYADGFEPITELNGDATIFEDGTWRGRRQLYPYTRSNLLPFSQAFDNAGWAKSNATLTASATTAPDGTATGESFNEGAVATATHLISENTSPGEVQGELRCYSVFLKASTLPNVFIKVTGSNDGLNINLAAGSIASMQGAPLASGVQTSPLWPGWFRFWFVSREGVTPSTAVVLGGCDASYAQSYTGTSRIFFAWGAMAERTSNLNGPTPYIPTPSSAAVTVTDYTLASGVFTPASVPAAGVFYSWSGAYYRRARIDMDGVPTNRLAQAMYDAKSIQLVSVK